MVSFKEFMDEGKLVNRWAFLKAGLYGGFLGALLATTFFVISFVI